ncbi:MAG: hypothetical protein J6K39_02320 [Clostridia bacterium]|nr:hypothetical protein [Clostridia bacterium]
MKNNYVWAKTLLMVYRYLERIAGAIDKIVMQSALNCSNISGQNYFYNNVMSISQKIIDLSERKVTLINLKILIEECLKEIPQKDAIILIEKFFDGVKTKNLVERHHISMRTVFRKIEAAVNAFSSKLMSKGYSDLKIDKMLENEGWIRNVYVRLSKAEVEDFCLSKTYLAKAVSM